MNLDGDSEIDNEDNDTINDPLCASAGDMIKIPTMKHNNDIGLI